LSSKIIPREQQSTVRKLDLDDLAKGAAVRRTPVQQPPAQPDAKVAEGERKREREQAYQAGLEAGQQEAGALAAKERAELHALIGGINDLVRDFEQTLGNDVLSLSLELAKLIVRQSLKVKPELLVPVLREAIATLPGVSEDTALVLHPADADLVRKLSESDRNLALPWKIVEDPHLERGGCRLDAPTTEVDATLETRWRRIIAALGRDDPWIDITT
jgi:flagellar assembly protein FliH